jgi:iron only hydrogenase large subunit-like protein
MPVIASECPGWVCYAEKRVGDLAVEHMSHVKSPQ